jgi:hypothetical protein
VLITPYGATTDISDPTTGLLVTGSDCGTPADVTATDLTPTSALITWTPLTLETAWNLKVSSTSLTDPATETGDVFDGTVSTTPEQAISVLTAETDYYVYVQADCGSDWSTEYMFTTPAACPQPTDLFASAIATDYAELDWTAYGETEWNIKVSTTTIDPTTDPGDVVDELLTTSKPYPVSGLTQNTTYYFYVQSSCGSDWSPEGMFTTECDAITTFPWNEDFETTSATVDCWTVIDNNDDGDAWEIQTSSTYANSGDQSYDLHTDYNSGDNDDYLISPAITLTGNEQLRFFERVRSSGEPNDFEVLLSTTGKDPADFTEVLLPLSEYDNTTYEEITLYLSAYTGTVYIAFHVPSGGLDGYHLYIDDVTIEPMPSCVPVTDLTVESTTTTSATIGWT